eukprot:scaffold50085_cov36-Phaeocystis_antarctica.AAC.1
MARDERRHHPLVHLARQLHAEGGDELDRVGDQDGVRRRRRLQLGQHVALAEVGEVDEAVGLRRAQPRGRPLERERDDKVDGRVLRLPVGGGVGGVLCEQRRDVAREEVGHLLLVVAAEAAHQVARAAAARVAVGGLGLGLGLGSEP